jgi:hypothetical protein
MYRHRSTVPPGDAQLLGRCTRRSHQLPRRRSASSGSSPPPVRPGLAANEVSEGALLTPEISPCGVRNDPHGRRRRAGASCAKEADGLWDGGDAQRRVRPPSAVQSSSSTWT